MKVLFIYPSIGNIVYYNNGISTISAVLKKAGHKTATLLINKEISKRTLLKIVKTVDPDMVCFSCVSNHWLYVKKYSTWIKERYPKLLLLFGGVHATICGEDAIKHKDLDILCIGEGEFPILELVEAIKNKKDYSKIKNLWIKKDSSIIKNVLRPLIQDLDKLPFMDRGLFPVGSYFPIVSARGCPFSCSYCVNHVLQKIYKDKGKYVRRRTAENIITEIKEAITKYPQIKVLAFEDDTFTSDKNWLINFCRLYQKEINIPFHCQTRVECVDDDTAKALKEAGCEEISIGVESGNEWLRKNVLNRHMTNDQIMDAVNILKKNNLKISAYYMIGFPYETPEMARETYEMHKKIGDEGFQCSVLYPYEKTEIYELAKKEGMLTDRRKLMGFQGSKSILNIPSFPPKELKKIYNEFAEAAYKDNNYGYNLIKKHYKQIYPIYRLFSMLLGPSKAFTFLSQCKKWVQPKYSLTGDVN